jgi:hypothetical protein
LSEYYLVFYSVHHLLRAERLLRERRVPLTLVPIPRQITSDCGLAVKLDEEYLAAAGQVVAEAGLACAGAYRLGPAGVERVDLPNCRP